MEVTDLKIEFYIEFLENISGIIRPKYENITHERIFDLFEGVLLLIYLL